MKNNDYHMALLEELRIQDKKNRDLESENTNLKIKLYKYQKLFSSLKVFMEQVEEQEKDEELERQVYVSDVYRIN